MWLGPPDNVLPATVALDVVLVRRPDLAIWVADALVFDSGLSFAVNVHRREHRSEMTPPWFFGPDETDGPRFGLQFADGRKVLIQRSSDHKPLHVKPDEPILRPCSGSGGGHHSRADMWLWPLPPAGPLAFVCAWPAEGIEETSVQIDAEPILEATSRAIELWPDERPLPPSEDAVVI